MNQHNRPATSAAEYLEATRDANKARELHPHDTGAIDLESFQLMSRDGQRAAWFAASADDKRGLALQIIRSRNIGPDAETIAIYLELCEAKFGSDQAIPPAADIAALASERAADTTARGDDREAARYGRVVDNLAHGARLSWSNGELLIRSASRPATYTTDGTRCDCPNGAAGRSQCWHLVAHELLLDMQAERAATADMAEAHAELDAEPQTRICRGCGESFRDEGRLCYACLSRGPHYDDARSLAATPSGSPFRGGGSAARADRMAA